MEEQHINPLAVTHLLQYTLRSLCCQDNSQWIYAVFWRILPRNYPPPKWDAHGVAYDRSRGNRRNWILVWEDGFCNFAASSSTAEINSGEFPSSSATSSANYGNCEFQQMQGLQPELFFKMSHEIYNYGEGLIGKVAADHSHKWIYKEANENQEINFLSAWHNSADAQPRTWEAQFQSGIKTIALIAVREGVVQLGAVHKVVEDLSYVVLLRKKFAYIESIPGVLLPHPSSAPFPATCRPIDATYGPMADMWAYTAGGPIPMGPPAHLVDQYGYDHFNNQAQQQQQQPMMRMVTPSMNSLEALLSKLPSVVPHPAHQVPGGYVSEAHQLGHMTGPTNRVSALELMGSSSSLAHRVAKEEMDEDYDDDNTNTNNISNNQNMISSCNHERGEVGECSSSMSNYHHQHFSYHQDLNIASRRSSTGF